MRRRTSSTLTSCSRSTKSSKAGSRVRYFKKSNFNHQKPTKQSAMKMQGRKVTPTKLSKSKEKEKKVPVLPLNKENSFE